MRDAHALLVRLLSARAGQDADLVASRATDWSSLTFSGQRHRVSFMLPRAQADAFARLAFDGLDIPGHLLIDHTQVTSSGDGNGTLVELAATTMAAG